MGVAAPDAAHAACDAARTAVSNKAGAAEDASKRLAAGDDAAKGRGNCLRGGDERRGDDVLHVGARCQREDVQGAASA
eukprot:3860058-Pleurochrysis_carterae.AAC.1